MPFQSTVNMVQVVDFLTGKGVSKEEAMEVRTEGGGWRVEGGGWRVIIFPPQFFGDVDREGEGTVNITYLLTVSHLA